MPPAFRAALFILSGLIVTAEVQRPEGLYAEIETRHGIVIVQLAFEDAPLPVTNFVGLAEGTLGPRPGLPYYDGLTFHRVISNYIIQGGDPEGTGEGGPGYTFPDQFSPRLKHDRVGTLSMANSGPDTNGSQFFFMLKESPLHDYAHSVFGYIIEGLPVARAIQQGDSMKVHIQRIGPAAQSFVADQAAFDALVSTAPKAKPSHLSDPDRLLSFRTFPWADYLDRKLANFERSTGHRLHMKLLRKLAPTDAPLSSESLALDLARRAGSTEAGITAVYLADSNLWQLSFGSHTAAQIQQPGESLSLAKQRILSTAADRAEAQLDETYSGKIVPTDRRIMRYLETLMVDLITLLESNPAPIPVSP